MSIIVSKNCDYSRQGAKIEKKMKNPAARPQGILTQGYLLYHIRSLTPQQATGNALAIRFKYLQRYIPSPNRCIVLFDNCLFYFAFLAFFARDCFFGVVLYPLETTLAGQRATTSSPHPRHY